MEAYRQSLYHVANHLIARFRRHRTGRSYVVGPRSGRRYTRPLDAGKRLAHHGKPWRIRGRFGDEVAPNARGLAAISILLSRKAKVEHRFEVISFQRGS